MFYPVDLSVDIFIMKLFASRLNFIWHFEDAHCDNDDGFESVETCQSQFRIE